MTALISLLGGGFMRLLPELLKLFSDRQDKAHEVTMTTLQLELEKAKAALQIAAGQAQSQVEQATAQMQAYMEAIKGQSAMTGVRWIDGLNQSVRPFLTYWWMILLTSYKCSALLTGGPVWGESDWQVLSMILGFWFVDRSIRYQVK